MHLKSITLKSFRCFNELHLELHPRLTVLVADNGGGKTSVLDAIAVGLSPVLQYFSTADQRLYSRGSGIADEDFLLVPIEDSRGSEHWVTSDYTQILVETTENLMWDVYRSSRKGKQLTTRVGQGELKDFCNAMLDSLKLRDRKPLPIFAYYGTRRGWIHKKSSDNSKVDYTQPTSALVGALESLSDLKEMLKWFYIEESIELRINKGRTPKDFSESPALSVVRTAIETILGGHYTDPHFNSKDRFVIKEKDGPQELQISQLSQGYQSMFALAMDFARRLAVGNRHMFSSKDRLGSRYAPAIMLVDELDLHLHPSWQQHVLDDLMRTFPKTQFIVTTHSPQVLTTVENESIRILVKDHEDKWMANTPAEQTRGVESADVLHSAMGVDPVPPVEEAKQLDDYRALIENGEHETQEGQRLRKLLEQHFGVDHPLIRDCDRLIRFQQFKQRQS